MSEIKIESMKFGNILSYSGNTEISFTEYPVTQLVGENGAGKSSIATILEEGLYNKNSRGLKKDAFFNWNSDKKEYFISVFFTKDGESYEVHKIVKSTAKVVLLKEGTDISGHTATQTYKLIEEIIGCDFTTFTKLIYQSVGSSLDFLKSTDANRKAFLTTLLSQEKYKEIADEIKIDAKDIKSALDTEQGKLIAVKKVIDSGSRIIDPIPLLDEVIFEVDAEELNSQIAEEKIKVALADEVAAKIQKRDAHNFRVESKRKDLDKNVQAAEESFKPFESLPCAPQDKSDELQSITHELAITSASADTVKTRYKKFKAQAEVCDCPTCGKPMDVSEAQQAAEIAKSEYTPLFDKRTNLEKMKAVLEEEQKQYTKFARSRSAVQQATKMLQEFLDSALSQKDDTEIAIIDVSESKKLIDSLHVQIRQQKMEIEKINDHNLNAEKQNAKSAALKEQLEKATVELEAISTNVQILQSNLTDLEILEKSFKDLVSYKLEYSVKAFEELINEYLSVLTSGKFALGFELDATKLVVVIYNDGMKTTIESCSTGQQHRIQLSTLLAIRKLMSAISKVNINLLFLDEVISFLDVKGMNTLIELLLEEHELNSFLVSHGMTHPLTQVLHVVADPEGNSVLSNG